MYMYLFLFFIFVLIIIFNDFHLGREVHVIYIPDGHRTILTNEHSNIVYTRSTKYMYIAQFAYKKHTQKYKITHFVLYSLHVGSYTSSGHVDMVILIVMQPYYKCYKRQHRLLIVLYLVFFLVVR